MLELFGADTNIVLGLSLHTFEESLLTTAVSLAQRTGSRLTLVHAVAPYRSHAMMSENVALAYEEIEKSTYDQSINQARLQLEAIREGLPNTLLSEVRIATGDPGDVLQEIASNSKASLIMCSYQTEPRSKLLQGISTAFSLMSHARIPVMLLPSTSALHFESQAVSVLIADNLLTEGKVALGATLGFCQSIDTRQLIHAYVHPMSEREIDKMLETVQLAMLNGSIPDDPSLNHHSFVDNMKFHFQKILRQRFEEQLAEPASFAYRTAVRFGLAKEELHKLVKESEVQILVYGKHHLLHREQLSFGKIPYEAMMDGQRATLIIPDAPPTYTKTASA